MQLSQIKKYIRLQRVNSTNFQSVLGLPIITPGVWTQSWREEWSGAQSFPRIKSIFLWNWAPLQLNPLWKECPFESAEDTKATFTGGAGGFEERVGKGVGAEKIKNCVSQLDKTFSTKKCLMPVRLSILDRECAKITSVHFWQCGLRVRFSPMMIILSDRQKNLSPPLFKCHLNTTMHWD